jgi:hypothetical protein
LDGWSVVFEPDGFNGSDPDLLCAVSRGTEALDVLRHDYAASHHVGYAVDGTTIVDFPPESATPDQIWGADPERLRADMLAFGLLPAPDGFDPDGPARAVLLAERVTGTAISADLVSGPLLSAQVEPWFVVGSGPGDLLRWDPYWSWATELIRDLIDAAEAAAPAVQRSVAVAEVRRQATALGVIDTPGLAEHLARAADGTGRPVSVTSDLGRHVRAWLADRERSSWSLNDGYRSRMTGDQRTAADALGWFTTALRGVTHADPRVAVLTALKPLTSRIPVFDSPQAAATILDTLRNGAGA